MQRASSRLLCAVLLAALLGVHPASARADADPASDVLVLQNVYLPYRPTVSKELSNQLTRLTKNAKDAGYPLKIAVIASRTDLGAVPGLFGRPQKYASFLGRELVYAGNPPLLVVMPRFSNGLNAQKGMPIGFGTYRAGSKAAQALRGLRPPSGSGPDALARAAVTAAERLSRAAGHPVSASGGGGSKSSGSPLLIFVAPLVLLLAVGAIAIRRRPRAEDAA